MLFIVGFLIIKISWKMKNNNNQGSSDQSKAVFSVPNASAMLTRCLASART